MTHLTHTGNVAGKLVCSANKVERMKAGDQFVHYQYADDLEARPQVYQPPCTECLAIYNDESNWE